MKIEVERESFSGAVKQIESYLGTQTSTMSAIDGIIAELPSVWEGDDSEKFRHKWNTAFKSKGSASNKFKEALEGYVKLLKSAEAKYFDAQTDVVNKAYKTR